jgi:hypothetical protein
MREGCNGSDLFVFRDEAVLFVVTSAARVPTGK